MALTFFCQRLPYLTASASSPHNRDRLSPIVPASLHRQYPTATPPQWYCITIMNNFQQMHGSRRQNLLKFNNRNVHRLSLNVKAMPIYMLHCMYFSFKLFNVFAQIRYEKREALFVFVCGHKFHIALPIISAGIVYSRSHMVADRTLLKSIIGLRHSVGTDDTRLPQ